MAEDIPLILDDAMTGIPGMSGDVPVNLGDVDVDDVDLFGGPVELSLPSQPPPSKQLQARVNEQRIRGANQRIAWSKQGTIASIGADGQSIDLRYLRTSPEDASWGLSEPTTFAQFSPSHTPTTFAGGPIVHLAWAATGHPELAVIDSVGRVSILAFSTSLNRPFALRSWESDPVDDLHAVVGCFWLPIIPANKQYNMIYGPAVKEESGYRYETTPVHASGPYHPNQTKSALLCVTVSGTLRLLFSQASNIVQDTSIELENITSSDDLATHASICTEKNMLLIAMVTASRQLKVVRAAIGWNGPQPDKQAAQQSQQLNPILQHKAAAVTTWLQHNDDESQLDISSDLISHVEMLPSALPAGTNQWSPPVAVVVREYVPTSSTINYNPEPQSIINRWELLMEAPPQPLHPAFEQLGFKPTQTQQSGNQAHIRLHRLPPIIVNKLVISVQTLQHGRVICFFFSDGTVQYRDRFTFEEIYNEPNPARISSLQQAGFQFTDPTPCIAATLSPTNSSFAQVGEDGKVKWNNLKYTGPDIPPTGPDPNYSAIVAGLTTAVSTASASIVSYDDILATARQFISRPRFAYEWMMEIVSMLKINVDYSEDAHHDQLVRNNSLHLCLSILNHLGFRGEFKPRSFYGKFSMLALNLRNIVILITIASNTPTNLKDKMNPLDEPDVVDALAGCTKWAVDLLAYTCDCIFNLLDDPKFMSFLAPGGNFNEMVPYLLEKNEIALHLILCSSTRGFLSAACRRLLHLDSISSRATQFYELQQQQASAGGGANGNSSLRPALIMAYHKMQQYTSSSLVKVAEFDKLLWELGEDIRKTYQATAAAQTKKAQGQGQGQAQTNDVAKRFQAHCELTVLLANNPPPNFQPLLRKFFSEHVRTFRTHTDPAKIYFADYSILEVEEDRRSLQEKRARHTHIDVFKRVEIKPSSHAGANGANGANGSNGHPTTFPPHSVPSEFLRRCARCTSIMEDVTGSRPGYTFVLAQQRKCSCSGNWGMLVRKTFVG